MSPLPAGRGWLPGVLRVPSPNCDARPAGCGVELVVLHGIAVPPGDFDPAGVAALFANRPPLPALRGLRVSAHFLIDRAGGVVQFVSCARRAWHAGESSWRRRPACNDYSLGIELSGSDRRPYAPAQYRALGRLLDRLTAAYPSIRAVVGHCHVAPGRKTDPGPRFDWDALYARIGAGYDGRPADA